jgi:hypothetical protein
MAELRRFAWRVVTGATRRHARLRRDILLALAILGAWCVWMLG